MIEMLLGYLFIGAVIWMLLSDRPGALNIVTALKIIFTWPFLVLVLVVSAIDAVRGAR